MLGKDVFITGKPTRLIPQARGDGGCVLSACGGFAHTNIAPSRYGL